MSVETHTHADGTAHEHTREHDHDHGPEHEHGHAHEHAPAGTNHQHGQLGHGAPVLNIGGDIGALVLYTDERFEGLEIDVSLVDGPGLRTHTEILRRTVGGTTFWAGVYSELPEGSYVMHVDEVSRIADIDAEPEAEGRSPRETTFSIRGGEVSRLDWR